jgi:hypothetical protein
MIHPIYDKVKDRLFEHDPVLRKLVKRIEGEDKKDDKEDKDREVSQRD